MNSQITESFKKAFVLTNKSWGLFLFGLLLSLGGLPDFLENSSIKGVLQVVEFLITVIWFGFSFSLPVFFLRKQEGKPMSFGNILSTTLKNTKRLILPFILIFIIFIIVGVVGVLLVAQFIYVYGGDVNFMQNTIQGFSIWKLIVAFFVGLGSFLTFSSIYFSLEKNGLFSSIKKSIGLGIKNLNFIMVLFVISASIYLVLDLLLNNYQSLWQLFLRSIFYQYETLLLTAASLIFYQKLQRRNNQ